MDTFQEFNTKLDLERKKEEEDATSMLETEEENKPKKLRKLRLDEVFKLSKEDKLRYKKK